MSTTTITRTWTVNGAPADVTSMVLRDPTAAFGVKRLDTGAIVVPSGTAMARIGLGVYSYTFADPATGLLYDYWEEVTDTDGAVYRFEKQRSGPAAVPSRSYLTTGDADFYASMLPTSLLAAWNAADDDAQTRALEQASSDVDAAGPWQGRKFDAAAQVRQFPRVAYESRLPRQYPYGAGRSGLADTIWDWDQALQQVVVPQDVKIAVLYQADSILSGMRSGRLDAQHDGVASQSVGGLSESYRPGGGAVSGVGVLARQAAVLMKKYELRSGRNL